ncbi:LysR family transcriptional regulator [Atopobacter phocae]|uniref:LysR family transcriptional regulator n=1 Tax=Atopobacter phocae TaxID=136492 RepID=UPI000470C2BC|nr:LysR family transcriptional regulator [Atopobacter phocae]
MDIEKIESFVLLCEHKNFSEVAIMKYTTQSTISKHIKSMEKELGSKLFERRKKTVQLTAEGELFQPYAINILKQYNDSLHSLSEYKNKVKKKLRIGTTFLFGSCVIPSIVSEYKNQHPDTDIKITINSSKEILKKLHHKEIDIAFISNYIKYDSQRYTGQPYKKDSLVLIAPPHHPFSKKSSISLNECTDEIMIIKSKESSLFKYLVDQIHAHDLSLSFKHIVEIDNQNSIVQYVTHGMGISIVSQMLLDNENIATTIKPIEINDFELFREMHYVYRQTNHSSLTQFIHYLNETKD